MSALEHTAQTAQLIRCRGHGVHDIWDAEPLHGDLVMP